MRGRSLHCFEARHYREIHSSLRPRRQSDRDGTWPLDSLDRQAGRQADFKYKTARDEVVGVLASRNHAYPARARDRIVLLYRILSCFRTVTVLYSTLSYTARKDLFNFLKCMLFSDYRIHRISFRFLP